MPEEIRIVFVGGAEVTVSEDAEELTKSVTDILQETDGAHILRLRTPQDAEVWVVVRHIAFMERAAPKSRGVSFGSVSGR